eukprot:scaffold53944_cov76-Phaeocystis_antarctica.AAC.2
MRRVTRQMRLSTSRTPAGREKVTDGTTAACDARTACNQAASGDAVSQVTACRSNVHSSGRLWLAGQ